jgi:hypothetical protein
LLLRDFGIYRRTYIEIESPVNTIDHLSSIRHLSSSQQPLCPGIIHSSTTRYQHWKTHEHEHRVYRHLVVSRSGSRISCAIWLHIRAEEELMLHGRFQNRSPALKYVQQGPRGCLRVPRGMDDLTIRSWFLLCPSCPFNSNSSRGRFTFSKYHSSNQSVLFRASTSPRSIELIRPVCRLHQLITYLNNTYGMYIKKNLRKQELVDRYITDPLQVNTVRSSSNVDIPPFSISLSL